MTIRILYPPEQAIYEAKYPSREALKLFLLGFTMPYHRWTAADTLHHCSDLICTTCDFTPCVQLNAFKPSESGPRSKKKLPILNSVCAS